MRPPWLLLLLALGACGDRASVQGQADEPSTLQERAEQALRHGDRDGYLAVVEIQLDALEAWAKAFERDLATQDASSAPQVRAAFRRFRADLQEALAQTRELRRYDGEAFEEQAERLRRRLESLEEQLLGIEEMRLRGGSR